MKIFYLSQVNLLHSYSGTIHIKEITGNFVEKGHEVWLFSQAAGDFKQDEERFHPVNVGEFRPSGIFRYLIYQIKLILKAIPAVKRFRPDVFYVRSEGAMFAHIVLKRLFGIPYYLELNSWPFRDIGKVRTVSPGVLKILGILFKTSVKESAGIIAVTGEITRRLREEYGLDGRVHTVANGANTGLFRPSGGSAVRKSLGLSPQDFVIGYVAYFQYYNDVEMVIRAVPVLKERIAGLKVLLTGGWAQEERRERVLDLINRIAPGDVLMTGEVPYEKVPEYIAASDICAAVFNTDVGDGSVMKAYEYLASGKRCIGSDISSLEFIKRKKAGLLVPVSDLNGFCGAVCRLYYDRHNQPVYSDILSRFISENHSWPVVADRIIDIMQTAK